MLPDLRIVIAAVLSTFVLTVGVGFYASSRLINESKRSTDSFASHEETPVNRIALSWPEPTRQSEPLALDFAVTAKALRNPVRDVTGETVPAEALQQPVRTTATDLAAPPSEKPVEVAPAPTEAVPAPVAPEPAPVIAEAPTTVPEPDIQVAVQYPPLLELPPELQVPAPITPSDVAAAPVVDAPAITGSVTEQPKTAEPAAVEPSSPAASQPDIKVVSRPEPAEANAEDAPAVEGIPLPKAAPGIKTKKAAPQKAASKKATPKKAARRPMRRGPPVVTNTVPNFFSFFTLQQR